MMDIDCGLFPGVVYFHIFLHALPVLLLRVRGFPCWFTD